MIPSVVLEHARAAAGLWSLRAAAAESKDHTRASLARIDRRLAGHLAGLQTAGKGAWALVAEALPLEEAGEPGEAGRAFVVAVLAIATEEHEALAGALDAAGLDPEASRGIVSALGWTPREAARETLEAFLFEGAPAGLTRLGIAGAALHRLDPGAALGSALYASDARLKARALRAAGELGRVDLLDVVRGELGSNDEGSRFWAAWSGALLGDAGAVDALWWFAAGGGRFAERAVDLAARATPIAAARRQLELLAAAPDGAQVAAAGVEALGEAPGHGKGSGGVRHLGGEPITPASLARVLREGSQADRLSAALELKLAKAGGVLEEVRGPAFRRATR